MSYETKYHQQIGKNLHLHTKRRGKYKIIILVCLLASFMFGISLRNKTFWIEFFIPGDAVVTAGAIDDLADELKMGVPFATAFEHFCVEIIEDE